MIPKLDNYNDLIIKLDYEIKRLNESSHIYDLLNCLLTLNSLPEWIINSKSDNEKIKQIASEKLKIMKGNNGLFKFDEKLLFNDINHQLRFIRIICNHTKHKTDSKEIPIIQSIPGTTLPMLLPARFCIIISIGMLRIDGAFLIFQVAEFWKKQLS
jgi:hypothetical protein